MEKVSVVIPAYNCQDTIAECLDSLLIQNYPQEQIEIIVVDDGSEDDTGNLIRCKYKKVKLVVNERNFGRAYSRARGTALATGDIIAQTDADCIVAKNWIENIVQNLAEEDCIVTGPVIHENTLMGKLTAITDFGDFQSDKPGLRNAFPGGNFAARRKLLSQYPFDKRFRTAEDRLLSWKLHQLGYKIKYEPGVRVIHRPNLNLSSLVKWATRYGYNTISTRRLDPTLPGGRFAKAWLMSPVIYALARLYKDLRNLYQYKRQDNIVGKQIILLIPLILLYRFLYFLGMVKTVLMERFPSSGS